MSDVQNKDWQLEQERVDLVVKAIDNKSKKLDKNAGTVGLDVLELRKTFWQDVTVNMDEPDDVIETAASIKQQAELLSERERTHHQLDRQLRTLARLKYSPYFGRIDFLEEGEAAPEQVYLGISSLMDEQEENFLIYDWRAPISSLYYDYPPGPAKYQIPDGTINGEMTLKRQFIIRSSEIKGMFDTGVTIGDEMLQEVLGNNASNQMKSIVATIQREQNMIIRNERSNLLIVQGVAGSGKTSAAMQRVAYLLYRYRGTLKSENILLFSPNPLFNSYVATVLPELGEENMQQTTFQEYLHQRLGREFNVEDPFAQMEYLLKEQNEEAKMVRITGIRFKAGVAYMEMIDQYAEELATKGMRFKNLNFRGETLISEREIRNYFYNLDHHLTIPNRIQLVQEWLRRELKKWVKRQMSRDWVEEEIQFLEKEDYLEAFKKLQANKRYSEHSFDDFEQEQKFLAEKVVKDRFKPLFVAVKGLKFIDMSEMYIHFFEQNHKDYRLPTNWEEIRTQTVEQLKSLTIPYEDATPYVYLQHLIEGRKTNTGVRHIFIDEAQDYTPIQFAFIQKLFPYSKITLLGDFNQAIYSGATGSQTVLTDLAIEEKEAETVILTKTYRSTKEIVEFSKGIIEGGEQIEPFNRLGRKPLVTFSNPDLINNHTLHKIHDLHQEGYKTIAIICRTAEESKQAYETLKGKVSIHLIEKGTLSYEQGVLVIPSYLAKGIEFDAVIVYDISQYRSEGERKLFYTVCTRAMHELHLFATNGMSPLMERVSRNTYEIDN
ncbi:RNA polymerase recycling motor HelD [Neobacillus sp. LXY-1]|uniref:RNA polymerase recycling motor HelD n=1 Tax=Neobacillus sp. LXY-1 TaxID=3379133 RepID=UPI003EE20205